MDRDDSRAPSEAVITAVADERDVEPREIRTPLYEVVDPDALDSLFRSDTGEVTFEYIGYRVTVTHDADVSLAPLDAL